MVSVYCGHPSSAEHAAQPGTRLHEDGGYAHPAQLDGGSRAANATAYNKHLGLQGFLGPDSTCHGNDQGQQYQVDRYQSARIPVGF
jgi:hypothetical protein